MCELSPVTFHGDTIFCIDYQSQPFTPMKPIVQNMGLDWASQSVKLNANKERWGVVMIATPSEGGEQKMLSMPVRKLPAWLNSINPKKVRPELRPKIELYQAESDDALWNYWMQGRAASSHPLADDMVLPASPDRPSRRSDPERKQLTAIINTWVSMAPIHYAAARAQVNAHFGVASVDALTVTQVREAIRWVQGKIDSLPAAAPALSGDEISALPPSTVSPYLLCLSRIEEVRELLRATCHPGAVTMKMTPQERKLYYACHAACVAADEALAGAYGILDAGRRMAEAARM